MFETIGVPELLIIGVVVILLFGVGKMSRVGKDLGTSVKEFRRAIREDDETPAPAPLAIAEPQTATYQQPVTVQTSVAPSEPVRSGPQVF